jgi:C4-dicarboxylate-specific signal transduction histidine kinase
MVAGFCGVSGDEKDFRSRVEKVLQNLEKMAAGNLNVRIPLSKRRDHLDALAFGINLLADEIQYKQNQDLKHREELMATQISLQRTLRKLEETQVKLVETAKLAALGEISAGMAHEINNPLTIIGGVMEKMELALEKDKFQKPEFLVDVETVYQQIDRISSIINQVKGFARQSGQEFQVIDLCQLVAASCHLYSKQLALQNVEIITSIPKNPLYVLAQANRLEQVFINILNNGKDAINSRQQAEPPGKITVVVGNDRGPAQVLFCDNGIGMSQSVLAKIFNPFFTTKDAGKGTGLGLSISHEIIGSHGGSIEIESEPKNGTQVLMTLPLVQRA